MRVCVLTLGTRGDVQPYLFLAAALHEAGHEVRLGAPDDFRAAAEALSIPFVELGVDIEALMKSDDARRFLSGRRLALIKLWREQIRPAMQRVLEAARRAADGAEVIVHHPKVFAAFDIAEATGARLVQASVIPIEATAEFPPLITTRSFGGPLNRRAYEMFAWSRLPWRGLLNRWRRESLGLGPGPVRLPLGRGPRGPVPSLCAVSPAILPRPADWPDRVVMTGPWTRPSEDELEPELRRFIAAGEPPLSIGFGSMTTDAPARTAEQVIAAVRRTGLRAVIAAGWTGLGAAAAAIDEEPSLFRITGAPHDKLFPKMAAVVHHGGAGTTHAGLTAGRPTLVCPVAVDQPFWGERVQRLGCGPEPLPLLRLSAGTLAERLRQLTSGRFDEAARRVSDAMAEDPGLTRAVEVIEAAVQDATAPP